MTRVLVCGGRKFHDNRAAFRHLDAFHALRPITLLIEGGARGADYIARQWADSRGVPIVTYRAQWHNYGHAAGPIRNKLMLDHGKPDVVIAFPGANGTAHMKKIARAAGVEVIEPMKEE